MNKLLSIVLVLSFLLSAFNVSAQKSTTETTFKVDGVCKMCKQRIEDAAYIKGVKFAEWSIETQMIKVIYKSEKVSEDDIHNAIAAAGHKTDKVNANAKALESLPGCCRYDQGIKAH